MGADYTWQFNKQDLTQNRKDDGDLCVLKSNANLQMSWLPDRSRMHWYGSVIMAVGYEYKIARILHYYWPEIFFIFYLAENIGVYTSMISQFELMKTCKYTVGMNYEWAMSAEKTQMIYISLA
jgi:hypothetical protein